MGEVDIADEADVVDDATDGRKLPSAIEPVDLVDLDVIDGDLLDREVPTEPNEPVDVPSIVTALARPEVVLPAHKFQLLRSSIDPRHYSSKLKRMAVPTPDELAVPQTDPLPDHAGSKV